MDVKKCYGLQKDTEILAMKWKLIEKSIWPIQHSGLNIIYIILHVT